MYIATIDNSGEHPLTSNSWRVLHENLSDLQDIELENLVTDDMLQAFTVTSEQTELDETISKVWKNRNKYSIMGLDDFEDVFNTNIESSILFRVDTVEVGMTWTKKLLKNL